MITELAHIAHSRFELRGIKGRLSEVERITKPDRYNPSYWLVKNVIGDLPYSYGCLLPHAVNAQRTVDEVFQSRLPNTFYILSNREGELMTRWRKASIISGQVKSLLDEMEISGVFDWRVKSLYSIFKKMKRFPISEDEIFDKIGVRIVVKSDEDVERIKSTLLAAPLMFRPIAEYRFKRLGKLHPPIRMVEKEDGYRALHMNLYAKDIEGEEELFELQLMTVADFNKLYPDLVPESRRMYKLEDQYS